MRGWPVSRIPCWQIAPRTPPPPSIHFPNSLMAFASSLDYHALEYHMNQLILPPYDLRLRNLVCNNSCRVTIPVDQRNWNHSNWPYAPVDQRNWKHSNRLYARNNTGIVVWQSGNALGKYTLAFQSICDYSLVRTNHWEWCLGLNAHGVESTVTTRRRATIRPLPGLVRRHNLMVRRVITSLYN